MKAQKGRRRTRDARGDAGGLGHEAVEVLALVAQRLGLLGRGVHVPDDPLQLLEGGRLVFPLVLQLQGPVRGGGGAGSEVKQSPVDSPSSLPRLVSPLPTHRMTTRRRSFCVRKRSLMEAFTSASSVSLGSCTQLCPAVDAPPGGSLPVQAYLRHSMMVVLPDPFCPTIMVKGE